VKTSQQGIDLIKAFEGFSGKPYLCPAEYWTIGYGNIRCRDGSRVKEETPHVTEAEAEDLLAHELVSFERTVDRLIKVPLQQGQYDALVSFAYNLGGGALSASSLRRMLNRGNYSGAERQFKRWVFAGGRKLRGLVKRRAAEAALFASAA
tara:strand:+ start:637 stop:1086 length:450 start_codon:yes stop_codon:yes gene_type:complete